MVSVREVEAAEFFGDGFRFKTYASERREDGGWSRIRQSNPCGLSILGRDPDFHYALPSSYRTEPGMASRLPRVGVH